MYVNIHTICYLNTGIDVNVTFKIIDRPFIFSCVVLVNYVNLGFGGNGTVFTYVKNTIIKALILFYQKSGLWNLPV